MIALIVSTSYNAGEYIERCVQSILDQTEEDMRAVCLMDGSEDNSFEKACALTDGQERITTVYSANNEGTHSAQKRAISLLNPEPDDLLVYLDGDDAFYCADAVEYVMNVYAKRPDLLLTYGSYVPVPFETTSAPAALYPEKCRRNRDYRKATRYGHCFNHLRTMKFKLYDAIPKEYTCWPDGSPLMEAADAAEMTAALEMAGDNYRFIEKILVAYNSANPISDWRRNPRGINKAHAYVESLPKLDVKEF